MKKGLIIIMLVVQGIGSLFAQDCLPFGITFSTQEQIDNFSTDYPGCTEISGIVYIVGEDTASITNLNGLSQITSITGPVYIQFNNALTSLSGLENLTTIGGFLTIFQNRTLESLAGLASLSSIGGDFTIYNNFALTSITGLSNLTSLPANLIIRSNITLQYLSGLENLTTVGGNINIEDNYELENVEGFASLNNVGGYLQFRRNTSLTSLAGLHNLTTVGADFDIHENTALIDLSGLENLNTVGEDFYIDKNYLLSSIAALQSLATISGTFALVNNGSLINTEGLSNLTSIGSNFYIDNNFGLQSISPMPLLDSIGGNILIQDNYSLTSIPGLQNITTIEGYLKISGNQILNDLSGLVAVTSIGGYTEFFDNQALSQLTGLENVATIGGAVFIWANNALENLDGLASVTSIGDYLRITGNNALQNIDGLASLTTVNNFIQIENNALIPSLAGLGNVDLTNVPFIYIRFNPSLELCGQDNICQYILSGGDLTISDNAPGCNSKNELLQTCFENVDHTSLVGEVIADIDQNCEESSGDVGISNWLVSVMYGNYAYVASTDSSGKYWLPILAGDWNLNVLSPSPFWTPCFTDTVIVATATGDTIRTDFIIQPQGNCPYLEWDVVVPPLRICRTNTFVVEYCNYGALPAEDVVISVSLDSSFIFQDASSPYTIDSDGHILFDLNTVDLLECGQFTIDAFLKCTNVNIWDVQCIHVELISDELCAPDPELWDGSIVAVNGSCENDSIYFELKNIGEGNMSEPAQFRVEIIIDDIVLLQDVDHYQLESGELQMLSYPIQGLGMRLEADQTPGYPINSEASVVVPNCENMLNNSILNLLPSNGGDPFMGSFCGPAIASFDPNIKSAQPAGIGPEHEIDKDWKIDYLIQFQNTGNDTAFLVVVKDTLSENLDLTTLSVQGASHPYRWALNNKRELTFTFENILLPDSTTNEPRSHGFFQYSIKPKADLLPADIIENRAGIYFDFNEAIITNTVLHTIRRPVVATSEQLDWCAGDSYQGQAIWQDTSIQQLSSLLEYDSVHFVHFIITPINHTSVYADVPIGDYFQEVLILEDTSFTISYALENACDSLVTYYISTLTEVNAPNHPFQSVQVYPNPVSDNLLVTHHQNGEAQHWSLFNPLGVAVWEQTLAANTPLHKIALSNFPSGMYWLQVKTDSGSAVWRVVKE